MMNNILSTYTYGLYTLMCGDNICIVDTACQASSVKEKPMYMSVSINKGSDTAKLIKEGEDFAIGVLAYSTPKEIVEQFGFGHSSEKNKHYGLNYTMVDGIRIPYEYLLNYVVCHPVNIIDCNTHYLIIGEVIDYKELNNDEPLTYLDYKEMN